MQLYDFQWNTHWKTEEKTKSRRIIFVMYCLRSHLLWLFQRCTNMYSNIKSIISTISYKYFFTYLFNILKAFNF